MMGKVVCAAIVSALAFTAALPTASSAAPVAPHVVAAAGTSSAAGAAATGGFIGFVAALDIYDLIRRTTCSGDFLGLGGPGFSEPLKVGMNVMTPQCPAVHKSKRKKRH
jgi:hypothetical protein